MLVTFSSTVHADIMMFGDVALTLIKLMGHSGTVPGAIPEEDVPAALDRLRTAIDRGIGDAPSGHGSGDEDEVPVNLRKRALPLIELLEAAAKAKAYVMWK